MCCFLLATRTLDVRIRLTPQDDERRAYRMTTGDRVDIEAGTEHAATAGPEGVGCMECYR